MSSVSCCNVPPAHDELAILRKYGCSMLLSWTAWDMACGLAGLSRGAGIVPEDCQDMGQAIVADAMAAAAQASGESIAGKGTAVLVQTVPDSTGSRHQRGDASAVAVSMPVASIDRYRTIRPGLAGRDVRRPAERVGTSETGAGAGCQEWGLSWSAPAAATGCGWGRSRASRCSSMPDSSSTAISSASAGQPAMMRLMVSASAVATFAARLAAVPTSKAAQALHAWEFQGAVMAAPGAGVPGDAV
jgi:hypothetical protein